jgi:hypothetical protein
MRSPRVQQQVCRILPFRDTLSDIASSLKLLAMAVIPHEDCHCETQGGEAISLFISEIPNAFALSLISWDIDSGDPWWYIPLCHTSSKSQE